ncbi:MAG: VTT domain-containing protein [Desulfobacteraceae bacterium]|nr:VTT domain-containing protein [Desulfobacteraceae bacterium]
MKGRTLSFLRDYWILLLITAAGIGAAIWFMTPLLRFYDLLMDRQRVIAYLAAWGAAAPIAFVCLQVLQVFVAPLPGEISGLIGGYLFDVIPGFFYSSIGLTLGSMINFGLGRILGMRVVRRVIPEHHLQAMDRFIKRQGLFLVLVLFVLPGFPKDYLSLFLGVSTMPFRVFLPIVAAGRMPGTLMLSMQGAFFFEKKYVLMGLVLLVSMILLAVAYRFRKRFYEWAERQDHG